MTQIKVGLAEVDYTPEPGLPLRGNFRGTKPEDYHARGTHDPLKARALVFDNGRDEKIALLQVDNCLFVRAEAQLMRDFIADHCDLNPQRILVAATHTHSGPATAGDGPMAGSDPETMTAFLQKAATAVVQANKNIKDAHLAVGSSTEDRVSFVRRIRCKDGTTHMNWEGLDPNSIDKPLGVIDPELITLSINRTGRPVAALVNFADHPAILAGDNWLYSADFPGYLGEALQRLLGPDFLTAFFNGPCGNVNHIDATDPLQGRGYMMTQRVGYLLAVAAFEAIRDQVPLQGDQIDMSRQLVPLPRIQISDADHDWSVKVMQEAQDKPAPLQVDGLPDEHYAHMYLELHALQDQLDHVEVQVFRIGDLGIVGIPGEIFAEFSLQIKQQSPAAHTIVIELANDSIGYLPTQAAFDQGGYEPTPGSTRYQPGAADKITASALAQLANLFE